MTTWDILDWAALALSFYVTFSLFWLGIMVGLSGNRRSLGTWLTGAGLLLGALFFTSHTAILGRGLADTSFGMDFWWWVSWSPAVVAPLAWYGVMLWYSGYNLQSPHPHHFWLTGSVFLALAIGILLVVANPVPSYQQVVGRGFESSPSLGGFPILVLAYLGFTMLCFLLPLDLLRMRDTDTSPAGLSRRRASHGLSRRRARPWLAATSFSLFLASVMMICTAVWALHTTPFPSLKNPADGAIITFFDSLVQVFVAIAVTLLGRAVVSFEVFTGRPLPRQGFLFQWRGTVLLAASYSIVVAWALVIQLRPIYSLMLATLLLVLFYALYGWQSFGERERFVKKLRPFVSSQNLYDEMLVTSKPDRNTPQSFFNSLCQDVLTVPFALLLPASPLSPLVGRPLRYPSGSEKLTPDLNQEWFERFMDSPALCYPLSTPGTGWAVSLWNGFRLVGVLFISEKSNGNLFTDEEMEIAQAGGERLLDMLAAVELARIAMALLRDRLVEERVLEGQGRRLLHDEVLPQLHTAILYLSTLPDSDQTRNAIQTLANAHREIADLMRAAPPSVPHRLEQGGLIAALHSILETDFKDEFSLVRWVVAPEIESYLRNVPAFISEVVFFAGRELIRNAARHGRGNSAGDERGEKTALSISLECKDKQIHLIVSDNGVGINPNQPLTGEGAGSGLRFHSAMLAAIGCELEISSKPGQGTDARINLPIRELIRTTIKGEAGSDVDAQHFAL